MDFFELRKAKVILRLKKWVPLPIKKLLFHLIFKKKPKYQIFTIGNNSLEAIIASNGYGRYCIPKNLDECPIRDALIQGDVFESITLSYIEELQLDGDIVHAGAYFGDFLPALSKIASSKNLVWAFEPSSDFHDYARATIGINKLTNVKLFNKGLGMETSSKWLTVISDADDQLGGMSHISEESKDRHSVPCDIVRLDDQVAKSNKVGLIHFDLEGYEEQALTGALRIINIHRPVLVLETLPSRKWIQKHLEPLGYSILHKIDANFVLST